MEPKCALDTAVCTGACGHSHPSREGAQDWIYNGLPFDLLRIEAVSNVKDLKDFLLAIQT